MKYHVFWLDAEHGVLAVDEIEADSLLGAIACASGLLAENDDDIASSATYCHIDEPDAYDE